jgi:hypothetical protein
MFDASQFLNATFTEANSTRITPAPEGEYIGQILPITAESIKSGTSAKGNSWARLDVVVEVQNDPRIKEACGMETKRIRGGIMLDLTESGGIALGEGKNIALGRLRAATGLNNPGQPFSFQMLGGRMVRIKVAHRADQNDPTLVYEDVKVFFPVS